MIEYLESRIAPAAVFTYTDIDGDKVKITTSKGAVGDLMTAVHLTVGAKQQLNLLDLSAAVFESSDVTFSVTKAGGGDGLAAVGRINGGTNDLGKVLVKGDLADLDAKNVGSINARTLGRYDAASAGVQPIDEVFTITGTLGSLTVAGDVNGVHVKATGAIGPVTIGGSLIGGHLGGADFGEISSVSTIGNVRITGNILGTSFSNNGGSLQAAGIGSVTVGGSVIGGSADGSGSIVSTAGLGAVMIGHNLEGGANPNSGVINATGALKSLTIRGSILGGTATNAGEVTIGSATGAIGIGHDIRGGTGIDAGAIVSGGKVANITVGGSLIGGSLAEAGAIVVLNGDAGKITVSHSLIGSTGVDTGEINIGGSVTSIAVGGSLLGGTADRTGYITVTKSLPTLTIAHDVVGGSVKTGSVTNSGTIHADHLGAVTISGSILGGANDGNSNTHLFNNASILADHDIVSITVKGDVRGLPGSNSGTDFTEVRFSALGSATATPTKDVAIGSIKVGGNVEYATIRAGYAVNGAPTNGAAQIGTVTVGHDWLASNLVAGTKDTAGDGFGDGGDSAITPGATISKIASVIIAGIVEGSPTVPDDIFAFEARAIGVFKVSGSAIAVPAPGGAAVGLSPITANDAVLRIL